MDLFSQPPKNVDLTFVDNGLRGWRHSFSSDMKVHLRQLMVEIQQDNVGRTVYPHHSHMLKAFNLPPENVKVVILEQDPYHNGNATGYAFACMRGLSPSLRKIMECISKTTTERYEGYEASGMDLTYLVDQGVFLLNTILSVIEGNPMSHSNIGWQTFTTEVLRVIAKQERPIVWMLWGKEARKLKSLVPKHHLLLEDVHPASAAYSNSLWNCDHFVKCNAYFKEHGLETIKWI